MKVSVIIPTFNRVNLLLETIQSFCKQTYTNWEAIVVDDGAVDKTAERVQDIEDKRIKYFKREKTFKKGPASCRNFGLEKATGDLILFFDDDDIAHPDLLSNVISAFKKEKLDFVRYERTVFYHEFDYNFDQENNATSHLIDISDLDKMVTNELPFNTCAVIWKRAAIGNERFNESLFYSDEWEFFQRLLSKRLNGANLNRILLYARKHIQSSTGYFQKRNSKYFNSTRKAMVLSINNLSEKQLLNSKLERFFIEKAFQLKDKSILNSILAKGQFKRSTELKYKLGFPFYSFLRPFFILKGKLLS